METFLIVVTFTSRQLYVGEFMTPGIVGGTIVSFVSKNAG